MTEFNLKNGQAIELTKDGVLIKGNNILITDKLQIVKNSKSASINQITENGQFLSVVSIDDEPKIMEPDPISYGRLAALEAKLSKAITEIDKLKATIKAERALTDNKITDAIIKWTVNGQ